MHTSPSVHTVIVNWNRWQDTCACIASVLSMDYASRIVVVDNGSAEREDCKLREHYPGIEVIRSATNRGFAGGVNLAIEWSLANGADYILALKNDMLVDSRCLAQLVAQAEQDPQAGMIGATIYYLDRPDRIWFAGANRNRWTLSLMNWDKGKRAAPGSPPPRQVDYVCAGAMLTRAEVFRQVGLFDPGYFMYYEDCDLCIRVKQSGYRIWCVPAAQVWHTVAASTGGEGSPLEQYYRTCSVLRFLRQHARGLHKPGLIALRVGYVMSRIVLHRLSGRTESARLLWRGLRDGLAGISDRPYSDERPRP